MDSAILANRKKMMKTSKVVKIFLVIVLLGFTAGNVKPQRLNYGNISEQEYFYAFTEATRFYLFGNYVQAISLYKECLRLKPQSSAVHFQLSKVYLSAGNIALAKEHAKDANEYSPKNKWYLQQLGDIYQMDQKFDSAILVYEQLVNIEKDNIPIVFSLASLYEKLEKYDRALNYLDSIDKRIGLSKEVSMMRYRIFETMKTPDLAIEALKAAEALSEEDYTVTGMIAEFYRRHNLPDSANKYYRKIYPEYKGEAVVVFSYADFLLERGKTDSAKNIIIEIMKDSAVDPIEKAGFFYTILRDENKMIVAQTVMDTIVEVFYKYNNNDIRSLSIYSDVQLRLRNFRKAADMLKIIYERDASNYAAAEQLVFALNVLGKSDSVILYSGRAIQQFRDRPVLYLFNGSAHYQNKSFESAVNSLNKGLAVTNDNNLKVEFYGLLAECYQSMGNYEASENAFKAALKLDNENTGLQNNYAYYLSLREKDLKFAEKLSRATLKAEPDNPTYLDTYAWILFKMGKVRKAQKYILEAIEKGGKDNEEILKHSAEIHIKLGKYAEAIQYLKVVLKSSEGKDAELIRNQIKEAETAKSQTLMLK